jgi:competence protein ComEA
MRTEHPTDRARRRLVGGAADSADPAEPAGDDGEDESETSLARWLPAAAPSGRLRWLTTMRADPGRAGVFALAAVGAVAVAVTVVATTGDDPPPVSSVDLPPVQMVSATPTTPAPGQAVVVSVVGLVTHPGLVTLGPGARVDDALAAAGGVLSGADLLGLNVARRLTDGEQIVVGIAGPPGAPPAMGSSIAPAGESASAPSGSTSSSAPAGPLDLNAATVAQLDDLPGVGPVTAAAIVAWRDANGRFTDVEQLGEVDGIGPARLEKLRALVAV